MNRNTVMAGRATLDVALIPQGTEESARRAEHRAGTDLLRTMLRGERGLTWTDTEWEEAFEVGEHGKPYLKEHPEIHFNISHSNGHVVCALADRPVGVDIERIDRAESIREPLIRRTLTEEEQNAMRALVESGHDETEIFFRFWTAKESYFKCLGCGLTRELTEVQIELLPPETPDEGWRVRPVLPDLREEAADKSQIDGISEEVYMEQFRTDKGFIITVCTDA